MKKIILAAAVILILFPLSLYLLNRPPSGMHGEPFEVGYGETIKTVASRLKSANFIRSEKFFSLLSYATRRQQVKAGRYDIHFGMTGREILNKLTRSQSATRKIVIPEGFNIYQIADRLDKEKIADRSSFLYYCFDEDFLKSVGIEALSCEGYLFPDTYVIPEGSDPRDVIARMHKKMLKNLREIESDNRREQPLTPHQILILASFIEEEAKVPAERVYISSVFHNRIVQDMKFECDPTVRYAVKKFTGKITRSDLEYDSPYNTYVKKGFPPTPICCPGRESIKAAYSPAESSFLFFVARNDGSHYFSKTMEEHNRAVDFYQRGKKNDFKDRQRL